MKYVYWYLFVFFALSPSFAQSPAQLEKWLKQYPAADSNRDGSLSKAEAQAYYKKLTKGRPQKGTPKEFTVDPGWNEDRFPHHAMCYQSPKVILNTWGKGIARHDKPTDGALRVVGTGHSFMQPGYKTLPLISKAAGMNQPLFTHTGGGITGSARYKWEQENGIFQFDRKPQPKVLAAIANAEWDAMMWGPYYNDKPAYYTCWIDFCLKHHPHMQFYLSDAWPQLSQLDSIPKTEAPLTAATFKRLGEEKHIATTSLITLLNKQYPGKVHTMPTSRAMVLAVAAFHDGKLPGVEGINRSVGGKTYSIWKDQLGHLGPWFDRLEGYVFYATLYKRSPELITSPIHFPAPGKDGGKKLKAPDEELDRMFRKIAWQAVIQDPLSHIIDPDGDGIGEAAP